MNTARWDAWIAMLRQSDATLVQLATMAAAAVLIWEMFRQVPDRWREPLRTGYLAGLLILYAYLIGGQMMGNISETVAIVIVMFVAGVALRSLWDKSRAAKAAAKNSTVENQEAK